MPEEKEAKDKGISLLPMGIAGKLTSHPDEKMNRISLDFDGVITLGETYRGPADIAPMRPGTKEFLEALQKAKYEIVIHTARKPVSAVKEYLRKNGVSRFVNDVCNEKLPSKCYLDDRNVEFDGDFKKALRRIKGFKPFWEKEFEKESKEDGRGEKDDTPGD